MLRVVVLILFSISYRHVIDGAPPANANNDEPETCSVCMDPYSNTENGVRVTAVPCNHAFHMNCINGWINSDHDTCVLCRGYFTGFRLPNNEVIPLQDPRMQQNNWGGGGGAGGQGSYDYDYGYDDDDDDDLSDSSTRYSGGSDASFEDYRDFGLGDLGDLGDFGGSTVGGGRFQSADYVDDDEEFDRILAQLSMENDMLQSPNLSIHSSSGGRNFRPDSAGTTRLGGTTTRTRTATQTRAPAVTNRTSRRHTTITRTGGENRNQRNRRQNGSTRTRVPDRTSDEPKTQRRAPQNDKHKKKKRRKRPEPKKKKASMMQNFRDRLTAALTRYMTQIVAGAPPSSRRLPNAGGGGARQPTTRRREQPSTRRLTEGTGDSDRHRDRRTNRTDTDGRPPDRDRRRQRSRRHTDGRSSRR